MPAVRRPGRRPSVRIPKGVRATAKPFFVICGECYEGLVFEPREGVKEVYCAECDHGGQAPSVDWLRKWAFFKSRERLYGALTVIFFFLMLILGFVWLGLLFYPANWQWNALNYVFLGLEVILFFVVIIIGHFYEKNKYEAYF